MENYHVEEFKPLTEVTQEDLDSYCNYLGLDLNEDKDLIWVANKALKASLPEKWVYYVHNENGESFFYNKETGESVEENPIDTFYFQEFKRLKAEKEQQKKDEVINTEAMAGIVDNDSVNKKTKSPQKSKSTPKKKDNSQINEYKKKAEQELQKLKENHEFEMESLRKQYSDELARQERMLSEAKNKTKSIENSLSEDQKNQIQQYNDHFEAELLKIKKANEEKLNKERAKHEVEINRLRSQNEEKLQRLKEDLRREVNGQNQRLQLAKSKNEEEIAQQRRIYDKQLSEMAQSFEEDKKLFQAKHKKDVIQLQAEQKIEIDTFKEQHKKQVEALRKAHEEKIKTIKAKAAAHLADARRSEPSSPRGTSTDDSSRRRLEMDRELAKLEIIHKQKINEIKEQQEKEVTKLRLENQLILDNMKSELETEIRRAKRSAESERRRISKESKERAIANTLAFCSIDTYRVASIKPRPSKLRRILKRSMPFSLNLFEDDFPELTQTRTAVLFAYEGPTSDSDSSLTEVEPFKEAPRNRMQIDTDMGWSSDDEAVPAQPRRTLKIQKAAQKQQASFAQAAERAANRVGSQLQQAEQKSAQLRQYCSEQNRELTNLSLEFQAKTLELSKMVHSAVMDLEGVHMHALNSVSSARYQPPPPPADLYSTQRVCYTPQPPRKRRRDDDEDTSTIRFIRAYEAQNNEARDSSRRLRKALRHLSDSDV